MRPVVIQMGVTLDGYGHGAKGFEDWGLPPEDDEVVAWKVASLREAGTHIMGRVSYKAMASVWPNETGVYADVMNEIPKVVFSATPTRTDWPESRIAVGDLAEEIDRLKRERDGIILAHGGATFFDALIGAGLVDEYQLMIHPVVIGHGTSLFGALREPLRLDLVEAAHVPERHRHPRLPTSEGAPMRTLHFGLHVADLDRSLGFYTAVGYKVVGRVPETPIGELTMLKLPDDEFVTIELVHDPAKTDHNVGTGLSHFVIQVEAMDATIAAPSARGVDADAPTSPDWSDDFRTTDIVDPDGNRIELVQWPARHAAGMSAADWDEGPTAVPIEISGVVPNEWAKTDR